MAEFNLSFQGVYHLFPSMAKKACMKVKNNLCVQFFSQKIQHCFSVNSQQGYNFVYKIITIPYNFIGIESWVFRDVV